ncbi:electron transport complex protein RnfC [Candidatus Velamenicoccus archaeovorus]|uniref:Ion-translocating oxidoreductase complex subunit C n=1 Tax=Velamenicoccus archaeovorus TaxID=1930593 RepID=A0A410P5W6_VELA1|nr:electron transport complex subunit RsxC [Candidatus Velamenicoccus archaeovorus]QAT17586.1 electron transport complex protein RnfC [Candidatus Velamenicoccus archaeovorus]
MVRIEEHKHLTENKPIEQAALPRRVVIPLVQHLGKRLDRVFVKAQDHVRRGDCLATSDKGVFAPVHASISGTVKQVADFPHPVFGFCRAIEIESDGKDEAAESMKPRTAGEIASLTAADIRTIVFESGIVGLGGATFPTHIKLAPARPIKDFIVNGAECEPYLTADSRLMIERSLQIIEGVKLVARTIQPENVFIAIEDNKPQAIRRMKEAAGSLGWHVVVLKTAYPQGGEKQVIKSCLRREVPPGKLPFDIGVLVQNVGTVFAVYEAVYFRKPLYERVMTVSGACLENPKNLLARLGTPVKDLLEQCGPMTREPKRIIMGGPMMGIAQFTPEAPVIKGTSGILALDEDEEKEQEESFCVRCGQCVENCPIGLNPGLIALAIAKGRLDLAQEYGIMDCIECGLCAYLCPGRRHIVQAIKAAKIKIRKGKTT